MFCVRAFLPLLLMPFPSTAPYFVVLYYISLYFHHRPCVYCVCTVILLFSTTCYWGADRCWIDFNHFNFFDPIRSPDGSSLSTFGLQVPAFVAVVENWLERLLTFLGGGEPLAKVIRTAGTHALSSSSKLNLTPVTEAISAVLGSASGMAQADPALGGA